MSVGQLATADVATGAGRGVRLGQRAIVTSDIGPWVGGDMSLGHTAMADGGSAPAPSRRSSILEAESK